MTISWGRFVVGLGFALCAVLHGGGKALAQKPEPDLFAGPKGAVVCSSREAIQVYQTLIGDDLAISRFLERERGNCAKVAPGTGYIIAGAQLRLRKPGEIDPVFGALGEWGPSKEQLAEWARQNAEIEERNARARAEVERKEAERRANPTLSLNAHPGILLRNPAEDTQRQAETGRRVGSFAPTRPPGITRSAENDEFGRSVIRALQQTVPQLVNVVGRVTVRFTLDEKAGISALELSRLSGVPVIDKAVTGAIKQANFPEPYRGSTALDRTFVVTYIFTTQ